MINESENDEVYIITLPDDAKELKEYLDQFEEYYHFSHLDFIKFEDIKLSEPKKRPRYSGGGGGPKCRVKSFNKRSDSGKNSWHDTSLNIEEDGYDDNDNSRVYVLTHRYDMIFKGRQLHHFYHIVQVLNRLGVNIYGISKMFKSAVEKAEGWISLEDYLQEKYDEYEKVVNDCDLDSELVASEYSFYKKFEKALSYSKELKKNELFKEYIDLTEQVKDASEAKVTLDAISECIKGTTYHIKKDKSSAKSKLIEYYNEIVKRYPLFSKIVSDSRYYVTVNKDDIKNLLDYMELVDNNLENSPRKSDENLITV